MHSNVLFISLSSVHEMFSHPSSRRVPIASFVKVVLAKRIFLDAALSTLAIGGASLANHLFNGRGEQRAVEVLLLLFFLSAHC